MAALKRQVNGHHYTDRAMQPIELAYALQGTPCFTKVAKYTTRVKDDPVSQLDKAIHCVELEEELTHSHGGYPVVYGVVFSWRLICEFTDDIDLRYALQAMYHGQYEYAKSYLEIVQYKLKADQQ